MIIDNTYEPKPINKEEVVDALKTMAFGAKAFKRFNTKEREALAKAINVIRKYQKIEEIVMDGDDTHYKLLMQIREILDDGK